MKNYWDYSDKERSELTEEQIKSLLDVELMSNGALKPKPPVLKKVDKNPLGEKKKFFSITTKGKYGSDTNLEVCFETIEQANALIELKPFIRDYDYEVGSDNKYAMAVVESAIVPEELYSKEKINTYRSVMKARTAAITENHRLSSVYEEACRKSEKITDGVWKDWYEKIALRAGLKEVVDTFKEYLRLTKNDTALAMKFLGKAFVTDKINEARDWFPDQIADWPEVVDAPAHQPDPEPVAAQ